MHLYAGQVYTTGQSLGFGIRGFICGWCTLWCESCCLIQLSVTDYLLFSMVDFVCVPQFVVPKKGFMLGFNMSGFLRWNNLVIHGCEPARYTHLYAIM